MAKIFIDTNILIYSMDQFDPEKRQRCRTLLKTLSKAALNERSIKEAQELLLSLTEEDRHRLLHAMQTIESILGSEAKPLSKESWYRGPILQ